MSPDLNEHVAARILDLADPAARPRRPRALAASAVFLAISAFVAHAVARSGFPTSARAAEMSPAGARQASKAQAGESPEMKQMMAIGVAAAVSAGASAQNAVQWRVEDGGNGHWYAKHPKSMPTDWNAMMAVARSQGGDLIAISSAAEHAFVSLSFGTVTLGLHATAGSAVFTWSSGEPVEFSNWGVSSCSSGPYPNNPFAADRFVFMNHYDCLGQAGITPAWDDYQPSELGPTIDQIGLEWSADCNADGVVDYGQIRAGELEDTNANNIPDCCEAGTTCGCAADISGNGTVDAVDLAAVLSSWGNAPTGKTNADINRDGEIDAIDLAEVLSSWGACP